MANSKSKKQAPARALITHMQHYGELAQTAPPGLIRDLFQYLTGEETRHKLELEKIYYATIYRGGGV
jgi:hypothetical protein